MPPDLAARFDERLMFAVQQALSPWDGNERRRGLHFRVALPFGAWRVSVIREGGMNRRQLYIIFGLGGALLGLLLGAMTTILLT